tara:strand:+ start:198 stop:761 length:564 start_codon:yes stop_codon:yes gene_type:complete
MSELKENILRLRSEGCTYNQIVDELGCSKGTIAYHCNPKVKLATKKRTQQYKKDNRLKFKLYAFKGRVRKNFVSSVRDFQRRIENDEGCNLSPQLPEDLHFDYNDVLDQFIDHPFCYLSGLPIDLNDTNSYSFDHKIPTSKGGDNSLSNLGLCLTECNQAKYDKTPEDFFELCKRVLKHNNIKWQDE